MCGRGKTVIAEDAGRFAHDYVDAVGIGSRPNPRDNGKFFFLFRLVLIVASATTPQRQSALASEVSVRISSGRHGGKVRGRALSEVEARPVILIRRDGTAIGSRPRPRPPVEVLVRERERRDGD